MGAQVNFRTAFYNHKGMLITDTRAIAEHYLTGWFAIDFLSCLPVGYINYFSDDPATGARCPHLHTAFSMLDLLSVFVAPISGAGDDSWQRWVLPSRPLETVTLMVVGVQGSPTMASSSRCACCAWAR